MITIGSLAFSIAVAVGAGALLWRFFAETDTRAGAASPANQAGEW